jgi:hypothetical protein
MFGGFRSSGVVALFLWVKGRALEDFEPSFFFTVSFSPFRQIPGKQRKLCHSRLLPHSLHFVTVTQTFPLHDHNF